MTDGTYTLKEILFGLRNEYINITNKIKELETFLLLKENNYEKINIFLAKTYVSDEMQLICFLYERKNKITNYINQIISNLGFFSNQKITKIEESNNDFIIKHYSKLIDKNQSETFTQKVTEILNDEFSKNATNIYSGTGYDRNPFLSISPFSIYSSYQNDITMDFTPYKDEFIHIGSLKGFLTKERIKNIFQYTFPQSKFPDFHREIINNSLSIKKDIEIIGNFKYSKKATLEINENEKKLILKKK